ncbi:GGDEF domain-containing protein [Duganella qianjiadongensis]|uniref:diguanylate cyclase n=1 Tax=Duganella qianjiadongensis TaxID=2692176 RepID=A0ABW9VJ94_9BURK|nr:GGDEF domain-containing protein [Duganella qianjiadongensis]MYM39372.1 diguanylate cyclase [Duganella qianjiadongensis]
MVEQIKAAAGSLSWLQGRQKRSLEEVILILLCMVSIASVLPFALFRLWEGSWLSAGVDLSLVVAFIAVIVHVLRTGRHRVAGLLVTLFYSAGMLATVYLRGVAMVYWVYPTTIAAYFILRPRMALAINAVAMAALVLILSRQLATLNLLTIVVTLGLVNLFAYIFADRTGLQTRALHTEVERDFLTGVLNRRALDRKLGDYADERRPHLDTCLLLLDIDHFKSINDEYGHAVGDAVLVRLCTVLRQHTRASDRIFRYGGEEFAIIASGAELEAAERLAENLRMAVSLAQLLEQRPVTVSIGVALMDKRSSPKDWLEQADQMLYRAKEDGRNTVRVAPPKGIA